MSKHGKTIFQRVDEAKDRTLTVYHQESIPELVFEERIILGDGLPDDVDRVAATPAELAEIVQAFRIEADEPGFAAARPPEPLPPVESAVVVYERDDLDADSSLTVRHAAATDEFLFDVYLPGGVRGPQGRVTISAAGAASLARALTNRLAETRPPTDTPPAEPEPSADERRQAVFSLSARRGDAHRHFVVRRAPDGRVLDFVVTWVHDNGRSHVVRLQAATAAVVALRDALRGDAADEPLERTYSDGEFVLKASYDPEHRLIRLDDGSEPPPKIAVALHELRELVKRLDGDAPPSAVDAAADAAAIAKAVGFEFGVVSQELIDTYFNAKKGRLRRKPKKGGLKDRRFELLFREVLNAATGYEGAAALRAAAEATDRVAQWVGRCRRELEAAARRLDDADAPR